MKDAPETISLMAETAAKRLAVGDKSVDIRRDFEALRGEPFEDPQWKAINAAAIIIMHLDAARQKKQ